MGAGAAAAPGAAGVYCDVLEAVVVAGVYFELDVLSDVCGV